jgi:predicted ATPase/class 3 adenylate cyclase
VTVERVWPSGTVTFLFTDIEASTRQWETRAEMGALLAEHFAVLDDAIGRSGGVVFSRMGDGVAAAFESAPAAARAALDAQLGLVDAELRARMGLHTGEATPFEGDYLGRAVNRAARVMAVGHGGQILLSRPTAALVSGALPDGASTLDLGPHRLRDLSEPEHLHQITHPALPVSFPHLKALDFYSGNLPVQRSSFVGRTREVSQLRELAKARRVLTLVGVGGVGKTRLAIQTAADLLPEFPGGAWLVELARTGDPLAVPVVAAAALGARSTPGRSEVGAVVDHLGVSRALVILDNCEHVLDAAADLVAELVAHCPNVVVLATSREPLDVEGEQLVPVRPLDTDEAPALFTERALDADPSLALGDDAAVEEICRRLDGIPLAVELAAARVATMTIADIAAGLDDRFRLLASGRRRAVERHQTLRSTLEWSYQLLAEPERRLLRRLGVFAGGFTFDALHVVVSDPDVDETLGSLVRKSLVQFNRGAGRYRLLETIRAYALERLAESGEADTLGRAHAEWIATLVDHPIEDLLTVVDLRCIRIEMDNWREAVNYAVTNDDALLARRLCFSVLGADLPETARWAETALAMPGISAVPGAHWLLYPLLQDAANVMDADNLDRRLEAFSAGASDETERAWLAPQRTVLAALRGDDPLLPITAALEMEGLSDIQTSLLSMFDSLYRNLPPRNDVAAARRAVDLTRASGHYALPVAEAFLAMALRDANPDEALRILQRAERGALESGDSFMIATVASFGAMAVLSVPVELAVPHLRARLQDLQPFWNTTTAALLTVCLVVLHRAGSAHGTFLHAQLHGRPGYSAYGYVQMLVPDLPAAKVPPVTLLAVPELIEMTDRALSALIAGD